MKKYAEAIISANDPQDRRIQELIYDYILQNLAPDPKTGRRRRVMMLLFQGEDAVRKIRSVVGNISPDRRGGETIRDTYGDLIMDENGQVRYFEPAVLAAPTAEEAETKLKLWAQYSDTDGGVLENVIAYQPGEKPQRTLVLIKPENFRFPTGRPGNMIDFFSRTGLFIVGIKVHRMSVAQAMEFYGPVREVLRTKLKDVVAAKAKAAIEKELGFKLGRRAGAAARRHPRPAFGDNQFENIVRFMSGRAPVRMPARRTWTKPGTEKCIALVYEGVGRGAQDPRRPRADRSLQGAARLDPPRIRPDHHGQRRPRQRLRGERPARNGHRQRRREQLPPGRRAVLRQGVTARQPAAASAEPASPGFPSARSQSSASCCSCLQQPRIGGGKGVVVQLRRPHPLESRAAQRLRLVRQPAAAEEPQVNRLLRVGVGDGSRPARPPPPRCPVPPAVRGAGIPRRSRPARVCRRETPTARPGAHPAWRWVISSLPSRKTRPAATSMTGMARRHASRSMHSIHNPRTPSAPLTARCSCR